MERLAGELRRGLAGSARDGASGATAIEELAGTLRALEATLGAVEASTQAPAPAPAAVKPVAQAPDPSSFVEIFRAEARETLGTLEGCLARLCTPFSEGREAEVDEARRLAHNLKGSAGAVGAAQIAELAARVQDAMPRTAVPGIEASRAAAAIAGVLVDLHEAIGRWGAAPEPVPEPAPEPAEPARAEAAAPRAVVSDSGDRMVRVSARSLESLARQMENMSLSRARQERRGRELYAQATGAHEMLALCEGALAEARLNEASGQVEALEQAMQKLRGLQRFLARMAQESLREAEQSRLVDTVVRDDLRDLRMVPASTALEPLRRTARETGARVGKQIEFVLKGAEERLDRRILDQLKDPLVHMVRNAVDHGFESPEARVAAGKPAQGRLEVRVEPRGHRVAVLVIDDGAGISLERVRATAVAKGVLGVQEAAQLDDHEVLRLILRPSFSTAREVTAISGRGVGLDVVNEAVVRLGGSIEVDTTPGQGTTFTLDLPLTLAATVAVIIKVAGEQAAVPYESVQRILRLSASDVGTVAGRATVEFEASQVPFASLAQVLGLPQGRLALEGEGAQPSLLMETHGQRVIFAVDEVVGQQEIVVHSLGRQVARTPHLGGAAVLDDGRVVAVLNAPELVRLARPMARARSAEQARPRILVADDSLTTRSAMKAVLEIAGYQVLPASDGEEGWRLMQETPCQLIVSDVQMPLLDGLGLTRRVKADARLAGTPVILVTSLDSASDRAAGLEAGADGYLVKRDVERGKLLELVKQLLPARA